MVIFFSLIVFFSIYFSRFPRTCCFHDACIFSLLRVLARVLLTIDDYFPQRRGHQRQRSSPSFSSPRFHLSLVTDRPAPSLRFPLRGIFRAPYDFRAVRGNEKGRSWFESIFEQMIAGKCLRIFGNSEREDRGQMRGGMVGVGEEK